MEATTPDTQATAPAPLAELSLDDIIASELTAADAKGAEVVKAEAPAAAEPVNTEATPGAEATAAPATAESEATAEPAPTKADDITAARVRKMLDKLDERVAALNERETRIAEREQSTGAEMLAELLRAPKATLAKFGKSIDDLIDSSLAEGKAPAAKAEDDADPRLTALEKRIEARERAEAEARSQAQIDARKAEIHREIAASKKFPAINESKRADLVTDYMIEYHAAHGKPISWDKAAATVESDLTGLGIAVAKKLGWSAPAKAAPAPAATPPADRPGTVSIGGEQRSAAPTTGEEPTDPDRLMEFLVAQAGLK